MTSSKSIIIVCEKQSPRLVYVLDWVFKTQLGLTYQLVSQMPAKVGNTFVIGYGVLAHYCIPLNNLLFEEDVTPQTIEWQQWKGLPIFYYQKLNCLDSLPFDIFSAIFFLISRYEEYCSSQIDIHQRYPVSESVLYKKKVLDRPIIDEWLHVWAQELQKYGVFCKDKKFSFLPTFDIDIAYSYAHKGLLRSVLAILKDCLKGNIQSLNNRLKVLYHKGTDPYDSFDDIIKWHNILDIKPLFFMLLSMKTTKYDKNISPTNRAMQLLTKRLESYSETAIHPSYFTSEHVSKLKSEKHILETIVNRLIVKSRQHYIRLRLPYTYQLLIEQGIEHDYSMGYSTDIGFRAGTSNDFYWFDISNNSVTNLLVTPFCFMDTAAHFQLKLSKEDSFNRLNNILNTLKQFNGQLVTVFHNFSLGTEPEWRGWSEEYRVFLKKI